MLDMSSSLPEVQSSEAKASTAFRTISEVANNLEVPQHVLRFWESKFQQVRPLKRGGGRRYYRPEDVVLLSNIKELLYNQGMTIRGVQKLLKETGRAGIVRPSEVTGSVVPTIGEGEDGVVTKLAVANTVDASGLSAKARREMEGLLYELKKMRDLLRQTGV